MALETVKHLAELADRLTKSADAIHAHLMKELKGKRIDLETAQLLFQDEVVLRQRAKPSTSTRPTAWWRASRRARGACWRWWTLPTNGSKGSRPSPSSWT